MLSTLSVIRENQLGFVQYLSCMSCSLLSRYRSSSFCTLNFLHVSNRSDYNVTLPLLLVTLPIIDNDLKPFVLAHIKTHPHTNTQTHKQGTSPVSLFIKPRFRYWVFFLLETTDSCPVSNLGLRR
jgi:hypothetical protein